MLNRWNFLKTGFYEGINHISYSGLDRPLSKSAPLFGGRPELKIGLVSSRINSFAGVPKYVSSLARALAREHKVTIFSADFGGMDGSGVRHRRVDGLTARGNMSDRIFGRDAALQLRESRRAGEFDIVHYHHYHDPVSGDVITSHYCEEEGTHQMARHPADAPPVSGVKRRRGLAMARLERTIFRSPQAPPMIAISDAMKREFIRHHGVPEHRVFVIHSGVDSTTYSPAHFDEYRKEVRRRYALGMDKHVAMFVGGDWERKGLARAIEALSLLRSDDTRLLVVGAGNIQAYRRFAYDHGVGDGVIFAGRCPEIWKYYAAADVFVLPTRYEPFGLTILEAMASGLPVLVSRRAGAAELIEDGRTGLLLDEPQSPREVATKLELLLSSHDLRLRIGHEARATAAQQTWGLVAQWTAEVYSAILEGPVHGLRETTTPAV